MEIWGLGECTFNTFLFDEKKEKAIYKYLCKKKSNKKLLTDEIKFESFHSWEQYIVKRYEAYSKASLIEFSKFLNLNLRQAKESNDIFQSMGMLYLPIILTAYVTQCLADKFQNGIFLFISFVVGQALLIAIFFLLKKLCGDEERVYFFEDVKDIIDKMIKER